LLAFLDFSKLFAAVYIEIAKKYTLIHKKKNRLFQLAPAQGLNNRGGILTKPLPTALAWLTIPDKQKNRINLLNMEIKQK